MGKRKKTLTEILSYTTIGVSLALMSGLALGHATEQSMRPPLAAAPPADPVERYALGQNAYKMPHVPVRTTTAQPSQYTDASYEIGRYENGARILTPYEPARKIERLRLERLQAWNDENFGSAANLDNGSVGYAESDFEDYEPIDVGAVADSPESAARPAILDAPVDDSANEANNLALDVRMDDKAGGNALWADAGNRTLSNAGGHGRPGQQFSDRSYNPKTPSIP